MGAVRLELQHVSVPMPAGGQAAARAFYGGLLGLEERDVPPKLAASELVWFRAGGDCEVHVFEASESPPGGQHFCLRVDEGLAALRAKLEGAGVGVEDVTEIVGRPRFMCRDPFGNRLELTEWE